MKQGLILLVWLTGFYTTCAQPYAALDTHARTVCFDDKSDLPQLVQKLLAPARTDVEKARVLFLWTATNIRYDTRPVKPYQFGFIQTIDTLAGATRILRSQQGVCTDYSLLLYQLLRLAGLPARIITGYAKGHPNQAGTPVRSINHQWNMVFLDGRWQPLDVTWGSDDNGSRPANLYYFLTPPAQFVADHFPNDVADQQIDNPLTKAQFDALPRIYDPYFTLGFGPVFPRQGLYQINKKLELPIGNPAEMEFMVLAHRYNQPQHERTFYTRAFRRKKGYDLAMQVFRDGVYSVHVLARPKGDLSDYKLILTLTVISGTKS